MWRILALLLLVRGAWASAGAHQTDRAEVPPTDDPVAAYYASCDRLHEADGIPAGQRLEASWFPWSNVVTASEAAAIADPAKAYAIAAAAVLKTNPAGGVVYFPPATYTLVETLQLVDRVILRGAPTGPAPASNGPKGPGSLAPSTVFNFPDRAYSRFSCANCTVTGVVNILSDGAGLALSQREGATASHRMFLVLGNVLRHVVYKYPVAPPATFYQEWPYRFSTAVAVAATENVLIANNLLTKATRTTEVAVSFFAAEGAELVSEALPADNGAASTRWAAASCSSSVTLHQNFTLHASKGVRSEAAHMDSTGDALTAACCARCVNNTYCIGFQAQQTGKHSNCMTYECPTVDDGSPSCTMDLTKWVAPKKPTHKDELPAVGLWSGPPRPKLPPKHPPKPPHPPPGPPHHPHHPPGPPHHPPGPPHPHPPAPPTQNCSLKVAFAYDNRYGIWHQRTDPSSAVVNVSIVNNYVHQNGRVGITWQSNDGLRSSSDIPTEAAAGAPSRPTANLGQGVVVFGNHVEVEKNSVLWSVTGTKLAHGASTNENRGYGQSGHSATDANSGTWFEKNTGAINRQFVPSGCKAGSYLTTDGEGLLQQIQDGQVAERNIWRDNDFTFGSSGYMGLYALHAVLDMEITGNKVLSNEKIGLYKGGSTPQNGTGITDLHCSGNTPAAICK